MVDLEVPAVANRYGQASYASHSCDLSPDGSRSTESELKECLKGQGSIAAAPGHLSQKTKGDA